MLEAVTHAGTVHILPRIQVPSPLQNIAASLLELLRISTSLTDRRRNMSSLPCIKSIAKGHSKPADPNAPSFLTLSPELRNRVYDLLYTGLTPREVLPRTSTSESGCR